jgi:hypothetical protein
MPILTGNAIRQIRRHVRRVDRFMHERPYRANVLGPYLMEHGMHRGAGGHNIFLGKPDAAHASGQIETYSIYELTTNGNPQDTTVNQTNVYQESGFDYSKDVFCIVWEVDTADADFRYWSWPIELEDCELEQPVNLGARSRLTISGGAVTMTESFHKIRIENFGVDITDDLDTINGGTDGDMLVLVASDSTETVVCKDGTGNLAMTGDFSLTHTQDTIVYVYNGTNWLELTHANNAS